MICATGAAIKREIIVRSRKRINSSKRLIGMIEPKIRPPTSERYMSWVTETTATIKRDMGSEMLSAAIMEGVNISVKPTIIVLEVSTACGTFKNSNRGKNGLPKISKRSVLFASTKEIVPMHITTGSTPNHIPAAFLNPFCKNCPAPLNSATRWRAKYRP